MLYQNMQWYGVVDTLAVIMVQKHANVYLCCQALAVIMLKKVQMKLHRWLCVLACFPVAIFDQLQALTTSYSYVITSNTMAGWFEGNAGMGSFVQNACDLTFSG